MTALRLVCNSPDHTAHTVGITCPCGSSHTVPMYDDMHMCVVCWKPFLADFNRTPIQFAECDRDIHKELNYE